AVGACTGEVSLYVSAESWAHSLYEKMVDPVAVETVQMTTLPALLKRALQWCPNHEIVLKLNVEGAAGEILFPTSPHELSPVVEVHLDHEPDSPYRLKDLLEHMAQAGLDEVQDRGTFRLLRIRRSRGIV